MKNHNLHRIVTLGLWLAAAGRLMAQDAGEVARLKQQLETLQANFERLVREQRQQIEALQRDVERLQATRTASPSTASAATPPEAEAQAAPAAPARRWSAADPLRLGTGTAYVDIGLVGTFAAGGSTADDIEGGLQPGGHDPNQRGFTVQGVELNLAGAVDPYFRGTAALLWAMDAHGESAVELHEAWLETVALPGNLQVRAGQFFTEFGRLNPQHPHQWGFVDAPLVNARFLGPDGLHSPGARLSWLLPTPFYSELFLAVQNSASEGAAGLRGETAHHHGADHGGEHHAEALPLGYRPEREAWRVRSASDLVFAPRLATSFDLTDTQTLLLGASAAFAPNARGESGDPRTEVYGVDAYWRWKSPRAHGGFPFVSVQAEGMLRRYRVGEFDWGTVDDPLVFTSTGDPALLAAETLTDYGLYAQVLYGFRRGWVAGTRLDFVARERADYERAGLTDADGEALGRDPLRRQRWRVSPNLTWYPSEFSKLRLQYNYDDRADMGVDHSVWLQWELILGAHAAHKF